MNRKKRFIILLIRAVTPLIGMFFLLISCTSTSGPRPLGPPAVSVNKDACHRPFPKGDWQFVHAIGGTLPGGAKTTAIGVTAISAEAGTAHCVLMTVEGFVLFDAVYDGEMTVNRAVPPFDSPAFARGLMNDIQFIFFPPSGELIQRGTADDGAHVCRYLESDGTLVDVITGPGRRWKIEAYKNGRAVRSVRAWYGEAGSDKKEPPIPRRMALFANRPRKYTLTFRLIEAEPITEPPSYRKKDGSIK